VNDIVRSCCLLTKPPTRSVVVYVRPAWRTRCPSGRNAGSKSPPLPDGRTTPTRQGHCQKRGVRRKHEAEPMYVAKSEPAIWRWGEGQAGVNRRGLISGRIEPTWSRTWYGEVVRLTRGSPPALALGAVINAIKPNRRGEPEAVRVQRVADSQEVLMTQGRWSLVTERRTKPWRSGSCEQQKLRYSRSDLNEPISSLGHGKLWTKDESDDCGEPN